MIVNFYKTERANIIPVCSRNIEIVPMPGMGIKYYGQRFKVIRVRFNKGLAECNVYMKRIHETDR